MRSVSAWRRGAYKHGKRDEERKSMKRSIYTYMYICMHTVHAYTCTVSMGKGIISVPAWRRKKNTVITSVVPSRTKSLKGSLSTK